MGKYVGRFAGVAALALSATVFAMPAQAAVNLELGLAIDASGSMSDAEFNLQKNAYVNVLNTVGVIPLDGSVAIGVKMFAENVHNIYATTIINNAGDLASLVAAITGMSRAAIDTGGTNITGVISSFTTELGGNAIDSARRLIDISTDGDNNVGTTAQLNAARNAANAAGISINCIGIGQACTGVSQGPDSFTMQANNFAAFETSLHQKIITEVHGAIPEPSTWAMMIGGFALVGLSMRRRRVQISFA